MEILSKNKDHTTQISVRLRTRNLKQLDRFAKRNGWSRTYAIEELIHEKCNVHTGRPPKIVFRKKTKPTYSPSIELLTYQQVADECQVSVSNVRKWVINKQLKVVRLGHRLVRVRRDVLTDFLNERLN
jgi:excisionase family DNA binding protein